MIIKKTIATGLFLLCLMHLSSSAQIIQFDKNYTIDTWTRGRCVIEKTGLGFLVFGANIKEWPISLYEDRRAFAGIINYNGDTIKTWQNNGNDTLFLSQYNFYGEEQFTYACTTSDSNYLAVGFTQVYNPISMYDHDVLLVKFNSNLDTLWTKIISSPGDTSYVPNFIIKTRDNCYMLGGWQNDLTIGYFSGFLMKVDSNGNEIWQQWYPSPFMNNLWSIAEADNGDIICVGSHLMIGATADPIIYKVDSNGNNQQMMQNFTSLGPDYGAQVKRTNDGNFIAGMRYALSDFIAIPRFERLVKFDGQGTILFDKKFAPSYNGGGVSVIECADSSFMLVGSTQTIQVSSYTKGFMAKVSATGDSLWSREFDQGLSSTFWDVQQCSDGGFIMSGETYCCNTTSGLGYTSSLWIVKTDSLGLLITGIDATDFSGVTFGLPYPNPSTTNFTVTALVPSYSNNSLKGKSGAYVLLFDMQGKQLQELPLNLGLNTVIVDVSTYPSGNYLCVLVIDGYNVATKKVVVGR